MKDRVKEIRHLIYLKSELIKQTKKEIKSLRMELGNRLEGLVAELFTEIFLS